MQMGKENVKGEEGMGKYWKVVVRTKTRIVLVDGCN